MANSFHALRQFFLRFGIDLVAEKTHIHIIHLKNVEKDKKQGAKKCNTRKEIAI